MTMSGAACSDLWDPSLKGWGEWISPDVGVNPARLIPAPAVAAFRNALRSTPISDSFGRYRSPPANIFISISASNDVGNSASPVGKSFIESMYATISA